MIRFGFIAGDENDRLEASSYPMVALVSWTETRKMAKRYYCIALAGLFLAIFQRLVDLLVADLDLGLLKVLKRVRW